MCCNLIQKEVLPYDFGSVKDLVGVMGFHLYGCFLGLRGFVVVGFEFGIIVIVSFDFIGNRVVRYGIIYDLLVLSCKSYQNVDDHYENYPI